MVIPPGDGRIEGGGGAGSIPLPPDGCGIGATAATRRTEATSKEAVWA
jgi:hypothetical protein